MRVFVVAAIGAIGARRVRPPWGRRAFAMSSVAALGCLLTLSLPPSAAGHPSGCAFPRPQPPVGDKRRVYAIPHGCMRLAVPENGRDLPTVVVRQHDRRGRVVTRRFPLPDENLDRANGSAGLCPDGGFLFYARYPFVTVVSGELYDFVDHGECTSLREALLWTGQLSRLPSLTMTWWTHRPAG